MRLLLAIIVFLCTCASPLASNDRRPDELDRMIGQMIMVGFRGVEPDAGNPIVEEIAEGRIGGVVLFDVDGPGGGGERNIRSPKQLRRLTDWLQNQAGAIPLLIGIDQEGGKVNRLKAKYGFSGTVSARALGEKDDIGWTAEVAAKVARTLAAEGINLNFAPVVDLNTNPDNPVIGSKDRSFSADPAVVVRQARVWIEAHRQASVLSTLKHFPGHGSSHADSHLGFVDVTSTWDERELAPYAELIAEHLVDAVMTAHIFNSHLDPQYPATLSAPIITGILRNRLGFDGVVISDDLQMKAISAHYGLEKSIQQGIEAGLDILLFANNSAYDPQIAEKASTIIRRLVEEGEISCERIEQSYERIRALKRRLMVQPRPGPAVHASDQGGFGREQ
ncbi:MAG: glycoside hydrolase family 3 protein [Acidobacteriota bacterium]